MTTEIEKKRELLALQEKAMSLEVGEELNFTNPNDRTMEFKLINWAYRMKFSNNPIYFRKETRGSEVFIIREK